MANVSNLNNGTTSYTVRDVQAEALLVDNASKNLLQVRLMNIYSKIETTTIMESGITFTKVDEGGVYVEGTSTKTVWQTCLYVDLPLTVGEYIVYGGTEEVVIDIVSNDTLTRWAITSGSNPLKLDVTSEMVGNITVRFLIAANSTVNGTVYPMICRAGVTDPTFEPYYRTNKQLDKNITEIENYIGYTDNDIYGLEVDYENNKFTRLAGAVGKTGGADFDNIAAYKRKRCNLTDSGVVTAYYGDEAYTETGALTQAVTVNGTEYPVGTSVQVMVEQPKFYYKVVPLKLEAYTTQNGDIGYHTRKARYYISDTPKNGFKLHPAFIRNGAKKEKIYLSAYEGCLYDTSASAYITDDVQVADFNTDKMSSIANVKPMSGSTQNLTRENARKLAQNRGIGWEQGYIHTISASQLLFMIEYATLNSQTAIGNGVVNKASGSGNESENTGGTSDLGNVSGSVSNGEVSYRGEENLWGNIWKWEDGINIQNPNPFNDGEYGNVYVADNSFSDDTNLLPYENTNMHLYKVNGRFISAFGYDENFDWLFIPTETVDTPAGTAEDCLWNNNRSWRNPQSSGAWNYKSQVGLFCFNSNENSIIHHRQTGSRLVYIPDAEEIGQGITTLAQQLQALTSRVEALENG